MNKIEKIVELLGEGETEDALNELVKFTKETNSEKHGDAILLAGQYKQLKRDVDMGIKQNSEEFRRIESSIMAILQEKSAAKKTLVTAKSTPTPLVKKAAPTRQTYTEPAPAKSNLMPILLGILSLVVIGMGAMFMMGDDDHSHDHTDVTQGNNTNPNATDDTNNSLLDGNKKVPEIKKPVPEIKKPEVKQPEPEVKKPKPEVKKQTPKQEVTQVHETHNPPPPPAKKVVDGNNVRMVVIKDIQSEKGDLITFVQESKGGKWTMYNNGPDNGEQLTETKRTPEILLFKDPEQPDILMFNFKSKKVYLCAPGVEDELVGTILEIDASPPKG